MEPFAYNKPPEKDRRRLILLGLAATSLSVWYFDLVPHLMPVPTGTVNQDVTDPDLTAEDFAAMLGSPGTDEIIDERSADDVAESGDPLMAAVTQSAQPIEESFPEFASVGGTSDDTAFNLSEPTVQDAAPASTGIQQASFNVPPPEIVATAPKETILSAEVAQQLKGIDAWIASEQILDAHAALSRLYWKQPEVRSHIQSRIGDTAAEIYANPSRHFAEPYLVQPGDTLEGIAKQYQIPWQYLARVNRVTPETLQAGQRLKVLTGPFGAVVDLQKRQLTLHAHGWFVREYEVGIGKSQSTPTGTFLVKEKLENPTWYSPDGGVVDADDPSNPLGEYWIGLGNHIGIHGTIDPSSIGGAASRGCIHMGDHDIAEVFQLLGAGSEVLIR